MRIFKKKEYPILLDLQKKYNKIQSLLDHEGMMHGLCDTWDDSDQKYFDSIKLNRDIAFKLLNDYELENKIKKINKK